MKTYSAKTESVQRDWYIVDAEGKTLGRLAVELATRLRGKHKPEFTPNMDTGDHMIVINAEKIKVTGKKLAPRLSTFLWENGAWRLLSHANFNPPVS